MRGWFLLRHRGGRLGETLERAKELELPSSLAEASAPDAERRTKPRLRGRRRVLTVVGMLLALVGGVVAESGTAAAQPPPGQCGAWCNNPPAGVSQAEWNEALRAASFWSNHAIDAYPNWGVGHLDDSAGRGWPGQNGGRRWFDFWNTNQHRNQYIYYGGRFNDYNGDVAFLEQRGQGVSPNRAFSTGNGRTAPYVEYDIDEYGSTGVRRNARRIVRNPLTGNTYATFDHYRTFAWLGKY
jgi:hypothetical protein